MGRLDRIKDYTAGPGGLRRAHRGAAARRRRGAAPHRGAAPGPVFDCDFKLLGGDPTKGEMRVLLNGAGGGRRGTVVYAGAIFLDDAGAHRPRRGGGARRSVSRDPLTSVRAARCARGPICAAAAWWASGLRGGPHHGDEELPHDGRGQGGALRLSGRLHPGPGREPGRGHQAGQPEDFGPALPPQGRATPFTTWPGASSGPSWAMLCQTGCNSVTNPGTVLGRGSLVAPCTSVASRLLQAQERHPLARGPRPALVIQDVGSEGPRLLFVEPYLTASHAAFAQGLMHHAPARWTLLGLPGRHWRWRLRGAAAFLADQAAQVLASSLGRPGVLGHAGPGRAQGPGPQLWPPGSRLGGVPRKPVGLSRPGPGRPAHARARPLPGLEQPDHRPGRQAGGVQLGLPPRPVFRTRPANWWAVCRTCAPLAWPRSHRGQEPSALPMPIDPG